MAVKSPHLLLAAGNVRKMKANLAGVVEASALASIEVAIVENAAQLYVLGRDHFVFAQSQRRHWRQCVSRLYYAAFNVARAVRLTVNGNYSMDVSDHKNVGELPEDFPRRDELGNRLRSLRDDRNLCDYDHTAQRADLADSIDAWSRTVEAFLKDAADYLRGHGVQI